MFERGSMESGRRGGGRSRRDKEGKELVEASESTPRKGESISASVDGFDTEER